MRAPPARKPSTGEPPGSLQTAGTTTTLVSSSQMVSSSPCSCFSVSGMGILPSTVFAISCSCSPAHGTSLNAAVIVKVHVCRVLNESLEDEKMLLSEAASSEAAAAVVSTPF